MKSLQVVDFYIPSMKRSPISRNSHVPLTQLGRRVSVVPNVASEGAMVQPVMVAIFGVFCAVFRFTRCNSSNDTYIRSDTVSKVLETNSAFNKRAFTLDWGGCDSVGSRVEMEDFWCVNKLNGGTILYCGVFDGHGGSSSSAFLKDNLCSFVSDAGTELCERDSKDRTTEHSEKDHNPLALAFERADSALLDHLGKLGDPECWSGSTATVVFITSKYIVTANVGDSRAVLGKKGRTFDVSSDHRPLGSSKVGREEIKRVSDCGGWVQSMRVCGILAVTRAFGDYEFKGGRQELLEDLRVGGIPKSATLKKPPIVALPDVRFIERTDHDDFLIIATDGLWDVMNSAQAVTFVRSLVKRDPSYSMDQVARALVERAIKSRTQDNVSCIVVNLRSVP